MPADPFASFSDDQLQIASVALQLACGRTKTVLSKKRNLWFCIVNEAIVVEAANRGVAIPVGPHHVSAVPPGPPAL
jgi:hypothetical protein